MLHVYTFAIFDNGREIENVEPGAYLTEEAARECGEARLDDYCPKGSPNRKAYRIEVVSVTA